MRRARMLALLVCPVLASCATLADGGGGDANLPNAGAGPFRALRSEELGNLRSAPNALEDDASYPRDIAVLDADGDPASFEIFAYAAVTTPPAEGAADPAAPADAIVRFGALDGRSFDRAAEPVLAAGGAFGDAWVGAPAALWDEGRVRLYFAVPDGVASAISADGLGFERAHKTVLGAGRGWEAGAIPRSPSVVRLADGTFRMFYEVDPAGDGRTFLGEARSDDGDNWSRVGSGPALAPLDPATVPPGEAFDDAAVGSPFAMTAVSASGRPIVRVFYAGRDRAGNGVIGLAARFGDDGPLVRAPTPVFGQGSALLPREPCVVAFEGVSFLFVTQRAGNAATQDHPAVAAAVAPATAAMPPANPR